MVSYYVYTFMLILCSVFLKYNYIYNLSLQFYNNSFFEDDTSVYPFLC